MENTFELLTRFYRENREAIEQARESATITVTCEELEEIKRLFGGYSVSESEAVRPSTIAGVKFQVINGPCA